MASLFAASCHSMPTRNQRALPTASFSAGLLLPECRANLLLQLIRYLRPGVITFCGFADIHTRRSRLCLSARKVVRARGIGKDAAEGWLDLAKLVSSSGGPKSAFEDLAYDIGRDVYMDMNGWHLYLRDITAGKGLKLNQALAQQLGMEAKKLQQQSQLEQLLKKVPVNLGGGKVQVSLYDVLPAAGVRDLQRIVEDFARNS